jgi:nucleoid-associated protein YgaU
MRSQTKIAVGIGAVLIVVGLYYVSSSGKKPGNPVGDNTPPAADVDKTAESTSPPMADVGRPPVADIPPAPSGVSGVASPVSKQVEGTTKFPPTGESPRPKPSETAAPGASVSSPPLPPDRAGLSSLPPALPSDLSTAPPAAPSGSSGTDLPPNVAKESTPAATFTPRVDRDAPKTETASSGSTETRKHEESGTKLATSRPAAARTHVIQKGDNYYSLATKYFGSAKYHKLIESANPNRDAKHLFIGTKITIPESPTAAATNGASTTTPSGKSKPGVTSKTAGKGKAKEVLAPPDPARAYTVQPGDRWYSIAQKFLGRGEDYPEIFELNKERVNNDQNLLRPGLVIELPARAKMPSKQVPAPKATGK